MEIFAKGQLSYMILSCLMERDYYGLDIITSIRDKSNGAIVLKKPSVYSSLTRMEKHGQVASYTRASDIGPNRRYYSITELGKQTYTDLKADFERMHINVFKDYRFNPDSEEFEIINHENENAVEEKETEENDFFDFSSLNAPESAQEESVPTEERTEKETSIAVNEDNAPEQAEEITSSQVEELKKAITAIQTSVDKLVENDEKVEPVKNDEVKEEPPAPQEQKSEPRQETLQTRVQSSEEISEQNRRIYDISHDINKYKKRRSFAEDQMAFAMEKQQPLAQNEEETKRNIEQLKSSLLASKTSSQRLSDEEFSRTIEHNYSQDSAEKEQVEAKPRPRYTPFTFEKVEDKQEKKQERVDDARIITEHVEMPQRARKIEPPMLRVNSPAPQMPPKSSLPAPERDVRIDPSHKDIISQLYAKSKDSQAYENVSTDSLYDYEDLGDFYKTQKISFKVYEKPQIKEKHNTNFIYMVVSLITFAIASLASGLTFMILALLHLTSPVTNFLYILLPALLLLDVFYRVYNYKIHTSWEPKQMISQILMWAITLIAIGVVVGLNFICGLSLARIHDFYTTLILPVVFILAILPVGYYIKRIALVKYWK